MTFNGSTVPRPWPAADSESSHARARATRLALLPREEMAAAAPAPAPESLEGPSESLTVEGWLIKAPYKSGKGLGAFGRERRRWVVLRHDDNVASWHESPDAAPRGSITVASIRPMPNTAKLRYGLEFSGGSARVQISGVRVLVL